MTAAVVAALAFAMLAMLAVRDLAAGMREAREKRSPYKRKRGSDA